MKTFEFSALILTLTALTACSQSEKSAQNANTESAKNSQTYEVVTDATYPPFEFTDDKGNIVGLDVDLLNAIAENQGFRVSYRVQLWDGMFDELKNNKAQIIASAVSVSDNEDNIALLSTPYLQSHNCVVAADVKKLSNWTKGTVAAANNEDLHEDLIESYGMKIDAVKMFDTPFLTLKEVAAKRVDSTAADCTVLKYHTNSPTFKDFTFQTEVLPTQSPDDINLVFGVNPKNPDLLAKINQGLENIKQSGQYEQILQKWRLK